MKRKKRVGKASLTSAFAGAGTVLDLLGVTAPRRKIGSLESDVQSVGDDFAAVGALIEQAARRALNAQRIHDPSKARANNVVSKSAADFAAPTLRRKTRSAKHQHAKQAQASAMSHDERSWID